MHLELSLPEHLAQQPAFAGGPFAAQSLSAMSTSEPATTTSEPAEDDDDGGSAGAAIFNIAILLLIPLGMYFLLIRPQRRRRNEAQALQNSIGVGDEVVTTSGVYGFVTAIEEETGIIWLEIDDDVQIRISRAAVSGKVAASTAPAVASGSDDDDDDADDDGASAEPAKPAGRAGKPSLKGSSKSAPADGGDSAELDTE